MLTYNNWFNHSFSRGGDQPKYADTWNIDFAHTELNTDLDFSQAVAHALKILARSNNKLVVQYSGGLDSEVIIREALKNNIDVIPYTLRFINDLNDHEIYYCKILESELGIKINYIDIDIKSWYYDKEFYHGYCYFIQEYNMLHPAAPQAWWLREVISDIEGECCVINGSGDTPLSRRPQKFSPTDWKWGVSFSLDGHWKRLWFSENYYPNDAPLFYLYTPELQYSYLTHELFRHCVTPESFKLTSTSTRHQMYQTFYPEITPRTKYHGYEKVLNVNNFTPDISCRQYSCGMSTKHILYEKYIRMLQR